MGFLRIYQEYGNISDRLWFSIKDFGWAFRYLQQGFCLLQPILLQDLHLTRSLLFGADCCGPMITLVSVEDVDVDREKVELPDSNSDLMELNSEHESVISVQGGDV